jgi:hypothetical protein
MNPTTTETALTSRENQLGMLIAVVPSLNNRPLLAEEAIVSIDCSTGTHQVYKFGVYSIPEL